MILYKLAGAKNSFLIGITAGSPVKLSKPEIKNICSKTKGVNVDGVLFLNPSKEKNVDYKWDFYNSDGSNAEMCGNAARCAALLLNLNKVVTFQTKAGVIRSQVNKKSGVIRVQMTPIKIVRSQVPIKINKQVYVFNLLNSGVPHLVIEVKNIKDRKALKKIALIARKNKVAGKSGANVTFYKKLKLNNVAAITFERGVEGFTKACGTGAVAAAADVSKKIKYKFIRVKMPGGLLSVKFSNKLKKPLLIGDAKIYRKYELEKLLKRREK